MYLPGTPGSHSLPVEETAEERAEREDRMELHRAVMRGRGFYDWMTRPTAQADLTQAMASLSVSDPATPVARPLPVVNLLAAQDQEYVDALLQEALPADRAPFREYLTSRILGIGIVTAVGLTLA